jgi:hypothetical protein
MLMSLPAISSKSPTVPSRPLMCTLFFPAAVNVRERSRSVSAGKFPLAISGSAATTSPGTCDRSKSALTSKESAPVRIAWVAARRPRMNSSAWRTTDFPAPVSPVKTFNPSPNEIEPRSTTAKLEIESSTSITYSGLLRIPQLSFVRKISK